MPRELTAEEVRWKCDPALFPCNSTTELEPSFIILGQDRALSALKFGLSIRKRGFNIYVSGLAGTGRTTAIKSFLQELAAKEATPSDWCYVHNFRDAYRPKALEMPTGMALGLQRDMKKLIDSAKRSILKAFTSKEYADRMAEITEDFNKKREAVSKKLNKKAEAYGLLLQATPVGLAIVPSAKGQPMSEKDYQKLSKRGQEAFRNKRDELSKEIKDEIAKLGDEENEVEKKLGETNREVVQYSISRLFEKTIEKYQKISQVVTYLNEVARDITDNYEQFRSEKKTSESDPMGMVQGFIRKQQLHKYEVNVLVDNSELKGAPVVLELNPVFNDLFGRIEKEVQLSTLYTDFTMIKGGSMHQANGGYLVVRIDDILANLQSWEGLKRTLREKKLIIEEIGERLGFVATKSLRPEPIPLDIKVIMIGEPMFYYLLLQHDHEFKDLFKVKADFDNQMDKTDANLKTYATVICRICKDENLRHLNNGALAKIMEHSARLAGNQDKLSTMFALITDVVREASFWAEEDGSKFIQAKHINKTIDQRIYRSNLLQEKIKEMIYKGLIIIDHKGKKIGQVNGLAVIDLGDFAFGKPSRITASLGLGREGLIDIEREAKLGGRLHSKGVMILNGFIHDRYARDVPLSLSARLVFEQSYEEVEGDSASSAELYALLSRLAQVPIKQGIAVTGSVNQNGEVQAIGGVNEKIEGFFETCRAKGLNGKQGVLIPESNIKNLMLKDKLVASIKSGKFHIYPVKTINEGIEVLTGIKAGKRLKQGSFEPDSINDRVQKSLISLASKLKAFGKTEEGAAID
jgi:lon-related putative ATP-dependent protease